MNWPCGVEVAWAPGMPTAAGTWRAEPFTKMVKCAWMWKSVCSPAEQPIPSTVCPVVAVAVPTSAAPTGTGTPSGPSAPAAGAGWSVPRVLSGASGSAAAGEPPVRARVMPTAAPMTTTAAPVQASQIRRRRRRACSARSRAILSLARSRPLFATWHPFSSG